MSDPQGLAFDPVAADYDLGRARWPAEILEGIDGESVLDLAAGTGKLTALLVERYADVVAVEPSAGMRAVLERNVPQARSLAGNAERVPLDDASVDAVFVAEAFHWFDTHAAAREIARVLRPGGALLVCFNEWVNRWDPPLGEEAQNVLERWRKRVPPAGGAKLATGAWRRGIDAGPFTQIEERAVEHTQGASRDAVVAYYASVSSFAMLPPDQHDQLRADLTIAIPDVPYELHLRAVGYLATRI